MSFAFFKISEILHADGLNAEWNGPLDTKISNISTDSRSINLGDLFFAIKGDRFDGHDFVTKVFEKGAFAAVVNRSWIRGNKSALPCDRLMIVDDTLIAYQLIARAYLKGLDIPVVTITGSSGKTTTKEMIWSVLSKKYKTVRNIKSFNNFIGVPHTIFQCRPKDEVLISEVGTNNFGELERLSYLLNPDVCVMLNIGHAHLQTFKSQQGVLKAKMEIFKHARRDAVAITNADDDILKETKMPTDKRVTFGVENKDADIVASDLQVDKNGCYGFQYSDIFIQLDIPGRHMVDNALAAIAVAKLFACDNQQIKSGLEKLNSVAQRLQVEYLDRLVVLNDSYNANSDSCRAALAAGADIDISASAKRRAVFASMLELGDASAAEHRKLADMAKKYGYAVLYLFGQETMATHERAQEIGLASNYFDDKSVLGEALLADISADDLVLIKGSRMMEMETVVDFLKDSIKNK